MKILLIPAVFSIYSGLFPFFEDLLKKKNSYRVPKLEQLLCWRGLIENSTLQILGLYQENLKSEKMMHKLCSPRF